MIRQRLKAEADGLTDKFTAMGNLNDTARDHEEFRMRLEKHFEQAMAEIAANKEIAREQAEVLASALSKTNIDIVGGDGSFFNTFSKALSVGKAINGVVEKSPLVQNVVDKLLSGKDGQKLDLDALLQNPEVQALIKQFGASKTLPAVSNSRSVSEE